MPHAAFSICAMDNCVYLDCSLVQEKTSIIITDGMLAALNNAAASGSAHGSGSGSSGSLDNSCNTSLDHRVAHASAAAGGPTGAAPPDHHAALLHAVFPGGSPAQVIRRSAAQLLLDATSGPLGPHSMLHARCNELLRKQVPGAVAQLPAGTKLSSCLEARTASGAAAGGGQALMWVDRTRSLCRHDHIIRFDLQAFTAAASQAGDAAGLIASPRRSSAIPFQPAPIAAAEQAAASTGAGPGAVARSHAAAIRAAVHAAWPGDDAMLHVIRAAALQLYSMSGNDASSGPMGHPRSVLLSQLEERLWSSAPIALACLPLGVKLLDVLLGADSVAHGRPARNGSTDPGSSSGGTDNEQLLCMYNGPMADHTVVLNLDALLQRFKAAQNSTEPPAAVASSATPPTQRPADAVSSVFVARDLWSAAASVDEVRVCDVLEHAVCYVTVVCAFGHGSGHLPFATASTPTIVAFNQPAPIHLPIPTYG